MNKLHGQVAIDDVLVTIECENQASLLCGNQRTKRRVKGVYRWRLLDSRIGFRQEKADSRVAQANDNSKVKMRNESQQEVAIASTGKERTRNKRPESETVYQLSETQ